MFILELTLRAWNAAEENKRRTLQRSDVAQAITRTDIFDFLVGRNAEDRFLSGDKCPFFLLISAEGKHGMEDPWHGGPLFMFFHLFSFC